jgi:hypothetical protein
MSILKFQEGDVIRNVLRSHPKQSFYIYDGTVHGSEDFPKTTLPIYSFITKDGNRSSFKTISADEFNSQFVYGDILTGSSISFFTSSLNRYFYETSASRPLVDKTLRTSYDYYSIVSPHFQYSSSLGDKSSQAINVISIPSLMYGSSIKKGTVNLEFFVSGSLIGQLKDERQNGELVQTGPYGSAGSGSVAGVCFYKEGVLSITGSWVMGSGNGDYVDAGAYYEHKWIYFGAGIESSFGSGVIPNASFKLSFDGNQETSIVTMMCHAPKGALNYSNNPTFVKQSTGNQYITSSTSYTETETEIANISYSPYLTPTGSFEKTTYVSKVFLYDKEMNVVGVAKMARPIKKVEDREFTVKIKFDI